MRERNYFLLVFIIFLALVAGWIVQPANPGLNLGPIKRDIRIREGLDLQGGLQVQLEADVPDCQTVSDD